MMFRAAGGKSRLKVGRGLFIRTKKYSGTSNFQAGFRRSMPFGNVRRAPLKSPYSELWIRSERTIILSICWNVALPQAQLVRGSAEAAELHP
jgi:hypothetical protein